MKNNMLNSTKTWRDGLDELKGVRKLLQELWALNKDDHNRVNSDLSFIELRLGEIINNLTDLRKRDMEALIKMLPDYRMVFPEQDTEDIIKYKLGFNDGIQKIKKLIKDYYEN